MSAADVLAYLYTKQENDQRHIYCKSLSRCSGWVPGNRDRPLQSTNAGRKPQETALSSYKRVDLCRSGLP